MGKRFSTAFDSEELRPPSGYACPDCTGSLQTVSEGNFRCQVGHAWTADSLRAGDTELETALWVAVRSLQEKSKLARRLADSAGGGAIREKYNALADEAEHALAVLSEHCAKVYHEAGERGAG